jgi:hypothetical protein
MQYILRVIIMEPKEENDCVEGSGVMPMQCTREYQD